MEQKELTRFDMDELLVLYESVGWTNYTKRPGMLKSACEHSLFTLGAYDGDKLVGLIRCVGDGYSIVLIQDILVLPQYQRRGIGTQLLKGVLEHFPNVYQIQLLTDNTPKTKSFYRSVGLMNANDIGCCAFIKM